MTRFRFAHRRLSLAVIVAVLACSGAHAGEVAGIAVPLKTTAQPGWKGQAVALSKGRTLPIALKGLPAGKYRLAAEVRLSDRSSQDRDTIVGRYTFVLPKSLYRFALGDRAVPMTISPRDPKNVGYETPISVVFTGWLVSDTSIDISPSDVLHITCMRAGGFVQQMVLLDERAWAVEQLRASDQLTFPAGFGDAWAGMLWRPKQAYAVKTLDSVCKAMDVFQRSTFVRDVGGEAKFAELIQQGQTLKNDIEAFKKQPIASDAATIDAGSKLIERWQTLFAAIDAEIARAATTITGKVTQSLTESRSKANTQCGAGREAVFNADIATKYVSGTDAQKAAMGRTDDIYRNAEILTLTFAQNAAEFALKAKTAAAKPQSDVVFKDYLVNGAAAIATNVAPVAASESLCLNGRWDFSPLGVADVAPTNWDAIQVPNVSPTFCFNWERISDDQWVRDGAYWKSGAINCAWYRTDFSVPNHWGASRVVLRFEEVTQYAEIFVNGRFLASHCGGLIPFDIDVTKAIVPGVTNHLLMFVESNQKTAFRGARRAQYSKNVSRSNLWPTMDHEVPVIGIRGDVNLIATPWVAIDDVYVQTSVEKRLLTISTTVINRGQSAVSVQLAQTVTKDSRDVLPLPTQAIDLKPGERKTVTIEKQWTDPKLWGIGGEYGDPANRYFVSSVLGTDAKTLDHRFTEFGFRELSIQGSGFALNGKPIVLQGDSDSMWERYPIKTNRWDYFQANRLRREANINLMRLHRFQFQGFCFESPKWAGLLIEGEGPWWSLFSPDDITGQPCYDDPVWLANCEEYYRTIVRTYRNEPALVMWSTQNESLWQPTVEPILKFVEWSKSEAPHLIISDHGHPSCFDDRFPICEFHDYDLYVERMKDWVRVSGPNRKPMIVGEYWNNDVAMKMCDVNPSIAKGAERVMAKWLERSIHSYFSAGAAGVMPFTFRDTGSFVSFGSVRTMGPWGDLIAKSMKATNDKTDFVVVPVPWPSTSGPGGIRFEKCIAGGHLREDLNFFDPTRPVCTPTQVFYAWKQAYRPMPQPEFVRPPELVVDVRRDAAACVNVNVFVSPKAKQSATPIAVRTDANGSAWFVLNEPGMYEVSCEVNGQTIRHEIRLTNTLVTDRAGFDYIPRMHINATGDSAKITITPGKTFETTTPTTSTAAASSSTTLSPTATADAIDAKNGPAVGNDGFIRSWLLYGPFPNTGGRGRQNVGPWFDDLLKSFGGEIAIVPQVGAGETVEFKADDQGYWEPGKITIAWRRFTSPDDVVPLATAFCRNDLPGLEGSLQYVMGYAACWIESECDRPATLTIGSDDGYKIWLNHAFVAEHRVFRGATKDDDKHAIALRKGWNLLLLKIEQDTGGYEFVLRLLTTDGTPLKLNVATSAPKTEATPTPAATASIPTTNENSFTFDRWLTQWRVCGPFPNIGGRPTCKGFETDWLASIGGEAKAELSAGQTFDVAFPEYSEAYWNAGTIHIEAKSQAFDDGAVDLGRALVLADVDGLDLAPVQYVVGYAETTFTSATATEATLELTTVNGVKVWANGQLVLSEHKHMVNRDPGSQVLPKSSEAVYRVPISLVAGMNRLLVKLDVDYGPMSFRVKLTK